jgi:hypothetical protein
MAAVALCELGHHPLRMLAEHQVDAVSDVLGVRIEGL